MLQEALQQDSADLPGTQHRYTHAGKSLRHLPSRLKSIHVGNERDYLLATIENAAGFFQPKSEHISASPRTKLSFCSGCESGCTGRARRWNVSGLD